MPQCLLWFHVQQPIFKLVFLPFSKIGDDKTIKQWNMEAPGYGEEEEPINTILGKVCLRFHVLQ